MKLYKICNYFAYWFRFKATYFEMKYHLKQVLKGKEECYIRPISKHDRLIGKSIALAKLSIKYNIPIAVCSNTWKLVFEKDILRCLPKYFKKKLPEIIVINEHYRGRKYNILLMEECMSNEQMDILNRITQGRIVGYEDLSF